MRRAVSHQQDGDAKWSASIQHRVCCVTSIGRKYNDPSVQPHSSSFTTSVGEHPSSAFGLALMKRRGRRNWFSSRLLRGWRLAVTIQQPPSVRNIFEYEEDEHRKGCAPANDQLRAGEVRVEAAEHAAYRRRSPGRDTSQQRSTPIYSFTHTPNNSYLLLPLQRPLLLPIIHAPPLHPPMANILLSHTLHASSYCSNHLQPIPHPQHRPP